MSILPYQLEPEYSSSEEIEDHVSDSEEEEIGDMEFPSGENRATHTSWCLCESCLLYTSPSPRDLSTSRMPSSA